MGLSSTGQASIYLPPSSLRPMHALQPPWDSVPGVPASFWPVLSHVPALTSHFNYNNQKNKLGSLLLCHPATTFSIRA